MIMVYTVINHDYHGISHDFSSEDTYQLYSCVQDTIVAKRKDACFPFGCADAAAVDGRRGSNMYEVNPWLWTFGRGKPRLGGLSIVQTQERHAATASEARRKRAAEPKRVSKTAPA